MKMCLRPEVQKGDVPEGQKGEIAATSITGNKKLTAQLPS
jgi:hypothetical protein